MAHIPSDNLLYFAKALKHLRSKKDISQIVLAEICGISNATINHTERMKLKPRLDTLEIIAQALDTNVVSMIQLGKELILDDMPDLRAIFAKNVKLRRTELKMTQQSLASSANLSLGYFNGIEAAKNSPTLDVVSKIASALHVKPSSLIE